MWFVVVRGASLLWERIVGLDGSGRKLEGRERGSRINLKDGLASNDP